MLTETVTGNIPDPEKVVLSLKILLTGKQDV